MKTAVIYARYSSDRQTEQSIEGQLRVCSDYADKNKIIVVDTYIDRAMSGTNDNRPAFKQMIIDSSKKQWDYVIVYKLDRFSRNKYENAIHKKTLRDNGVKLLSAMENIPILLCRTCTKGKTRNERKPIKRTIYGRHYCLRIQNCRQENSYRRRQS